MQDFFLPFELVYLLTGLNILTHYPAMSSLAIAGASSSSSRPDYYCHTCEKAITAVFHPRELDAHHDVASEELDDQPTCPDCGDCFVEKVEAEDAIMADHSTGVAATLASPGVNVITQMPSIQTFQFPMQPGGASPEQQQPFAALFQNVIGMMSPLLQQLQQPQNVASMQAAGLMESPAPAPPSADGSAEQLLPSQQPQVQIQSFQGSFPPFHQQLSMQPMSAAGSNQQQQPRMFQLQFQQPVNPYLLQPMDLQPQNPQQVGQNPFGGAPAFNPFAMFQSFLGPLFGGAAGGAAVPGQVPGSDYFFGGTHQLNDLIHQLMMAGGNGRFGSPPASAEAVAALPEFAFDSSSLQLSANSDCSVCLEEFKVGDVVRQLPCKHCFHSREPDCLGPWLAQHASCPSCRYLLPTNDAAFETRRAQTLQATAQAAAEQSAQAQQAAAAATAANTAPGPTSSSSSSSSAVSAATPAISLTTASAATSAAAAASSPSPVSPAPPLE